VNEYEKLIEALTIFNKYDHDDKSVAAEHDVVYAGPNPVDVSAEDTARLEELRWHPCEYSCFAMYT